MAHMDSIWLGCLLRHGHLEHAPPGGCTALRYGIFVQEVIRLGFRVMEEVLGKDILWKSSQAWWSRI